MTTLDDAEPGSAVARFPSRGFYAMWTALGVSQLGSAVSAVTIPLVAAVTLGASPGQMGLLAAMTMAPSLLIKVPAAAWSDGLTYGRVPMMAAGNVAQALMITLVPVLWWTGGLTVPVLIAIVGGSSLLQGVYSSLASPLLVELVPKEHLPTANGRMSATRSAADIGGPALGGGLLAVLAAPIVVLIDAVSFLFSAALLMRIPRTELTDPGRAASRNSKERLGLKGFAGLGGVLIRRSGLQTAIAVSFVNGITDAILVLYLVRELNMAPSVIGLLLGLGAVGGIVGGFLVGWLMGSVGLGRTLAIGTAITMVSLVVLPFATPGLSAALGMVVLELAGSLGGTLMMAVIFGVLQGTAPEGRVARVMAVASTFLQMSTVAGALAGGVIATYLNLRLSMGINAALLVVVLVPQLIRWRAARWRIDEPADEQGAAA